MAPSLCQWRPARVAVGLAALPVLSVMSPARPQAYASDSHPQWLRGCLLSRPRPLGGGCGLCWVVSTTYCSIGDMMPESSWVMMGPDCETAHHSGHKRSAAMW